MSRVAFMGTPAFAVPCLAALAEVATVPLVVSQPDRKQGRGMRLTPPPVKQWALEHELPVWQPTKVRDGALAARLRELELDAVLVVAYGRILPAEVLSAPRLGCLNVHASLLPRWRGAAPIQWAVVEGDQETGVCLMQMDEGMDTGAVLARRVTPIGPDETAGALSERLAGIAGTLVRQELPRALAGELSPQAQPAQGITHARMLTKADGELDFEATARALHNRVRGLSPWPGAYVRTPRGTLKVHRSQPLEERCELPAGHVVRASPEGLDVACGEGVLRLLEVQPEGKRRMAVQQYLAGHALGPGQALQRGEDP